MGSDLVHSFTDFQSNDQCFPEVGHYCHFFPLTPKSTLQLIKLEAKIQINYFV